MKKSRNRVVAIRRSSKRGVNVLKRVLAKVC